MWATNNLHKNFFCKVAWAMNRPCQGHSLARQYKWIFFTIISIVYKVFSIVFSFFCFILFLKCFQGCIFSRRNLVKKNVFYRVTKGDLLIEKEIHFCKNQLPDVNLYLIFSLVISLFPVSINSCVVNLIMEKLWEALDPDLVQTVIFSFH